MVRRARTIAEIRATKIGLDSVEDAAVLTGGAERVDDDPDRGFVDWQPHEKTKIILGQVNEIFEEYAAYLPMTVRQIYYRMVARFDYTKEKGASKSLGRMLKKARRARVIPMDAIRNDGITELAPTTFAGTEDFLDYMRRWAEDLRLDRTEGQALRLVVWCEAAGMAPILQGVAEKYGITVFSSGGFDSVTAKYQVAKNLVDDGRPTEIFHIGDHDASGVAMFLALAEDVKKFYCQLGGTEEVWFTRLAITPDQIREYDLPMAEANPEDIRPFTGRTAQAEALPPPIMEPILKAAIEARLNRAAYNRVLKEEQAVRQEVLARIGEA